VYKSSTDSHGVLAQVCNFTAYAHTPIYLINKPNAAQTTGLTPFFCHSHLIMKINVGGPNANAGVPSVTPDVINGERLTGPLPQNTLQASNSALEQCYATLVLSRFDELRLQLISMTIGMAG
jgi:hypothetical protein